MIGRCAEPPLTDRSTRRRCTLAASASRGCDTIGAVVNLLVRADADRTPWEGCVSIEPPAKFFVNSGLVSNPVDIYHLLRPLLRQTVAYRYMRAGAVVSHGTGWVERIVADRPDVSSFFTPLSICLSVASWEHLEFETRPDQLITYTLVQSDERVVLEFVPPPAGEGDEPIQEALPFQVSPGYIQMELNPPDSEESPADGDGPPHGDSGGEAGAES